MLRRFPEKLRALREWRGMTQDQLGSELGFSRVYGSNLEHGKKRPGTELVFRIADLFGVSVEELVRDELELTLPEH